MRAAVALMAGTFIVMLGAASSATSVRADTAPPALRIEARSAGLMAVGIVHGDTMSIHVSRLLDNSPVRDAAVTVILRGTAHPATAQADGGYIVQASELTVPGRAVVLFRIAEGGATEDLTGALQVADTAGKPEDKNGARQLGWWVLNFAVCIGFLLLISRRRKAAARD